VRYYGYLELLKTIFWQKLILGCMPHPMDGVYAPPDWVRDKVVNAFFKLLDFEYGHNSHISRFGTSFMWDSYKYYPFAKLCSKLAMGNVHESLLHLYLPLLVLNNHWIIVVVQFKDWQIDTYDSLDNQHRNITKTLVQWFQAMFGDDQEWHVDDHYLDVSVQRQSDLYSCGFYTCWYAYKLVSQGSVGFWSNIKIEDISRQIFISLFEGEIVMPH
jgi:Ulp1 family protease